MRRTVALVVLLLAPAAPSQARQPARIDLRIVPQTGSPYAAPSAGGVVDLPGTQHQPVSSLNPEPRRFEVQYRLTDLHTSGQRVVACISELHFQIDALGASPGSTLDRAYLSRMETQTADLFTPPGPIDLSGPPDIMYDSLRGTHHPLRRRAANLGNDFEDNGLPNRGAGALPIPGNSRFTRINARIYDPIVAPPDGAIPDWFGLYSFEWTPGRDSAADQLVTFRARGESASILFTDDLRPVDIGVPAETFASVRVLVPAPGATITLLTPLTFRRTRRPHGRGRVTLDAHRPCPPSSPPTTSPRSSP